MGGDVLYKTVANQWFRTGGRRRSLWGVGSTQGGGCFTVVLFVVGARVRALVRISRLSFGEDGLATFPSPVEALCEQVISNDAGLS